MAEKDPAPNQLAPLCECKCPSFPSWTVDDVPAFAMRVTVLGVGVWVQWGGRASASRRDWGGGSGWGWGREWGRGRRAARRGEQHGSQGSSPHTRTPVFAHSR
eukprot:1885510-Rhodomonas_salina.3